MRLIRLVASCGKQHPVLSRVESAEHGEARQLVWD